MTDYTKCIDHNCPQRLDCRRYLIYANQTLQSYFMHSPRKMDGCPQFVDMRKYVASLQNVMIKQTEEDK